MSNLLSNAVKFTPEGGSIDLSITKDLENELRIVVCNRGIGMDAETQSRLFERFFKPNTRKRLPVWVSVYRTVKEVVEQLGGHITVSSKEGEGSVFEVKIPLTPIPTQQIDESFRPDPSGVNTPAEIQQHYNHVIVEDNPSIVRYYQACFGEQYHLLYAFDAHEALEMAKEQIPDLILRAIS